MSSFFSVRPNIFVGRVEGSAIYQKWYFEVTVDHMEQTTHMTPHLRIGWANSKGYKIFKINFHSSTLLFVLVTYHTLVGAKNGAATELVMIYTRMDLTAHFYGRAEDSPK